MAPFLFVLASACACLARAGETVDGDAFSSGTSFEFLETGSFDCRKTDAGLTTGAFFWYSSVTDETAVVVAYKSGEAYDYDDHGLKRSSYLKTAEPLTTKYLSVNPEQPLERAVFSRLTPTESLSNVLVKTENRDSIYCDLLTKFTSTESTPDFNTDVRISVWVQIEESISGATATNLMVAAGAFTNGYTRVSPFVCKLEASIDLSRWYRLTIRAHGDVSARNAGLGAFSIYLDGEPVRAVSSGYTVIDGIKARSSWLTAEARALLDDRRLFFAYAEPGSDKSVKISGFHFSGDGLIDDVTFSSSDPGYAKPQVVFSLRWDSGITLLKYSLDGGVTTNEAPATTARTLDLEVGDVPTNTCRLIITDCVYDTANGFQKGVWSCANGVTLTNGNEFVCDGTNRNPIAVVASTRDCVEVGTDGHDLFSAAFAQLDASTNEVKTVVLATNMIVSIGKDAAGHRDDGSVKATNPDGEYVLDLNGYTLQGSPKSRDGATLNVRCKSFRIIDSSADKTGRILPIESYTNSQSSLNTAIRVYPNNSGSGGYVEPVLTIEAGIIDGWVRNDGQPYNGAYWTGVVFVEGGSYISTNASTFYLESCVTNPMVQFVYRKGYWSALARDAYIWTGEGANTRWTTPANWRANAVPPAGKTALFPSRAEGEAPWKVDLGNNTMTTTILWLEGDVYLTGTNAFKDVTLTGGGEGRICGTATLVYEGVQPGKLTETILAPKWAGTVVLRGIKPDPKTAALVLKDIDTWGTSSSTVEFNGVRGYVRDTVSRTMEYRLWLRNYVWTNTKGQVVTNAAWQNDSGYTGTTLAYKNSLLGNGTFSTGVNKLALYQLFKFADVSEFTGKLDINGKRVLIGNDTVSQMKAGLVVFGTQAVVPLGRGWQCKRATFGTALNMLGETNQVLITCTDVQPDVTCCTNTTLNGLAYRAWLAVTDAKPWDVYATGVRPPYVPEPESEDDPTFSLLAPTLLTATAVEDASLSAAHDSGYASASLAKAASALSAAVYNSAAESVEASEPEISLDAESVTITVDNALPGLWYGIRYRASLDDEWVYPTESEWVQATGTTVSLTYPKSAEAGFFGVVASTTDPRYGGTE